MLKKSRDTVSILLQSATYFGAIFAVGILLFLIIFILIKGLGHIDADLFSLIYTSENSSLLPAAINTAEMTLLALLVAVPLGIFSGIYLVEYADGEGRFVKIIRLTAETLAGIPSIVYGLFGLLFFTMNLGLGFSLASGALTLALMVLPLIMRTSEEAIAAVPRAYREASFGLGAGKTRTILKIVLPAAIPGILSGIILAIGRIVGETAALIYTSGTVAKIAGLTESGRTLAVHMYVLSTEGLHMDKAFATAVVLLAVVITLNFLAGILARSLKRGL